MIGQYMTDVHAIVIELKIAAKVMILDVVRKAFHIFYIIFGSSKP